MRLARGRADLQGQLAPSGVLDGVLPSGQQPNSVLSQDDLSSAVGTVVLANVGPGGDTQGHIIIHEASENALIRAMFSQRARGKPLFKAAAKHRCCFSA